MDIVNRFSCKEHDWKFDEKDMYLVKKYEERLLQMGEGNKDIYVPHKCSSNMTSAEKEFNNQVDR